MMYTIRTYTSRKSAELGNRPVIEPCDTGNYKVAISEAEYNADAYGCAVIVNNETGNRTWFTKNEGGV